PQVDHAGGPVCGLARDGRVEDHRYRSERNGELSAPLFVATDVSQGGAGETRNHTWDVREEVPNGLPALRHLEHILDLHGGKRQGLWGFRRLDIRITISRWYPRQRRPPTAGAAASSAEGARRAARGGVAM